MRAAIGDVTPASVVELGDLALDEIAAEISSFTAGPMLGFANAVDRILLERFDAEHRAR